MATVSSFTPLSEAYNAGTQDSETLTSVLREENASLKAQLAKANRLNRELREENDRLRRSR